MTDDTLSLCPVSGQSIISRQEAIERGLSEYHTGKPCKHGHYTARSANDGSCISCRNQRGLKSAKKRSSIPGHKPQKMTKHKDGEMINGIAVVSRSTARDFLLKHYFSGSECTNGHVDFRLLSNGMCMSCVKLKRQKERERNPEKVRARVRESCRKWRENDPERAKRKAKESRLRNIDAAREREAKYREENRQEIRSRKRSSYWDDPEKGRRSRRDYYAKNPEGIKEANRQYRLQNPEVVLTCSRNARARKRKAPGSHGIEDIRRLYERQKGKCGWCKKKITMDNKHVDHIRPLSKGGSNDPSNLILACAKCNLRKRSKDPEDWARELGYLI